MESFHLFKPCGDHLVAHLYEHLVMQTIHRQLFEAGLFQAIDYQAYGVVYSDAGVMGIDATLYTMQAERFVAQLRQPVAEYDDAMIDCALRQIIAEKGYPLTYHDQLALHEALHQLDTEPWYGMMLRTSTYCSAWARQRHVASLPSARSGRQM